MRENVTYYPVRDFSYVRISCKHPGCKVSLELPPQQVEAAMKKTGACCPLCGKPFTKPDVAGGGDVVTAFARAVVALTELAGQVGIELPVFHPADE